jgi:membrane associated rhomboid family serine protease
MKSGPRPPIAWVWGISVVAVWVLIAFDLNQPLWQLQRSQDLVSYGAFKGLNLVASEAWRLLASQWLHVKFPHMLFNALMIAALGQSLERRTSAWTMLLFGLGGGAIGQYSSAVAYPLSFISGASQAYLALCGAILLFFRRSDPVWWIAVFGIAVAAALDLFVSSHGLIKIGHITALAAGAVGGAIMVHLERTLGKERA